MMANNLRKRSEVPQKDRWSVEEIYSSPESWEEEFSRTTSFPGEISVWSGRLGETPGTLKEALEVLLAQHRTLEKLQTYAGMKRDEDLSDSLFGGMASRIDSRVAEVGAASSFFVPELLAIPEETMDSWIGTHDLRTYAAWLENILRYRPHTLSKSEEKILAGTSEIIGCFADTFGKLSNVDMPARLPEIEDETGERVRLTNGNLSALLQKKDRRVRKDAFEGFYREVLGNVPTKGALLQGQVRSQVFRARTRNFASALEASLFNDRVDTSVYDSLISSVHDNLPAIHRYYRLRSEVLELSPAHMYDVHVPIVPESSGEYSWDDAVGLTLEATARLGSDYTDVLAAGFRERWADRYENIGKRSGAYSGGCYDSHPYILHNFNGNLSSVFTLAHEAGHSMHSYLSRKHQPYHTSDYRILVAEVASTTNEMLLIDLLLRKLDDESARTYILDHLLGKFRSTIVRQTMFAEFEKLLHEEVESGGSLTPDWLNETYYELVRLYHGDSFAWDLEDEPIAAEWSRIPHFYYNFYVYKYATGLSSAVDISSRILEGRPGAVESYMEFLKGGASKPPLELLRNAGVDLATPAPVNSALSKMEETLDELEELLD
ncbi:MAG: oligoendopeptidase F [Candidatus Fermentibacteraceae bacterium]|nr:oligoendopeptidase F [Candidatus Fermentibacteraceae bacterium]MBN2609126.1 oligoendopeptidase F [Candidatus Fermentibacteraceae bacterium]